VLIFWLGVSDRKASALCKGDSVWTMADLEAVTEGMGVDLPEMFDTVCRPTEEVTARLRIRAGAATRSSPGSLSTG